MKKPHLLLFLLVLLPQNLLLAAQINFSHSNWEIQQEGELLKGGILVLKYDNARLPGCRGSYNGLPAYSIMARVIFHPGGQVPQTLSVTGDQLVQFNIPMDAQEVEIWFVNSGRCLRIYYDSDFGRNFWFPIF